MEACLRLAEAGLIVGLQDLGAAGLTSAAVECAAKGGKGIELDVARVPRREKGMSPYEVMLSESQERMLVVVKGEREEEVRQLFEHWGLHSDIIGHVTDDGLARIREGNKVVAEAPVRLLTDPPLYESRSRKPRWLRHLQNFELGGIRDLPPEESNSVLLTLLSSPNIAAKKLVYQQYDHQVGDNTVIAPGGNAAVLRIKGTQKAISLTADSNGRYCYLDPYRGAAITVAEAGRNLVCTGAEPLAITDCLNFGNPENPDVYYQLRQSVRGMARACRILDIPVISGNVSLYNETGGEAIYPTPVTGMAGLIRDVSKRCTPDFKHSGDLVFLLGSGVKGVEIRALGGSEYLEVMHNMVVGRPSIDLELEKRVQRCCLSAIREGVLGSAHDCSDGGLAVALAESSIMGNIGFRGELDFEGRLDVSFFGECQSRIVVSVSPEKAELLEEIARRKEVLLTRLGRVGGKEFIIGDYIRLPLEQIDEAWRDGLERALRG
jgi:phosphoribosylformylglycinamidine synthase